VNLAAPRGSKYSQGQSINDFSEVAGYYLPRGATSPRAAAWSFGWLDLGSLNGQSSMAFAINNNSQIVGLSSVNTASNTANPTGEAAPSHAFIWEDGVMQDLNHQILNGDGWLATIARSINDQGQITGRAILLNNGETHAVLLTPLQ